MLKPLFLLTTVLLLCACKPASEQSNSNDLLKTPTKCLESQTLCEINTDFGDFNLKFSQQSLSDNIKTDIPFLVELTYLNNQPGAGKIDTIHKQKIEVSAYLEGKDMFMGKIPLFFQDSLNNQRFVAESLLASCSEEQMVWRLWITIKVEARTQTFFIDFLSQRL